MPQIKIPTPLRKFTSDNKEVEVEANTVKEAIDQLIHYHPELKPHLLDDEGQLKGFVRIYRGEKDIESLDGLNTELEHKETLSIIPAIAGGI